jgi:hypothetical protein
VALFRRKSQEANVTRGTDAARVEPPTAFLPARARRPQIESLFMRVIATGGIVGIGTAVAAILGSQDVAAWIIGIVVSGVTVILAAILWSTRML